MGCKVDSLIERHGLVVPDASYGSVDEYLVARWTGTDGRSPDGYKKLTEWFNKQVLKRIYEAESRDTVSIHLDREYELITDDGGIRRDELAADLATDALDIEEIADEMISWSTMRRHLKQCLDAEKETPSAETDWEVNTVQVAQERAADKARSVLSSLASSGQLRDADGAQVDAQVKLSCPDCSVRVPFEDAVERGYVCETHADTESSRGRVRDRSLATSLPYVAADTVYTAVSSEPLLAEIVTVGVI